MKTDADAVRAARNQLARARGQLDSVLGMIDEERDCRDVIQQIAAVSNATRRAGVRLLVSQLERCVADADSADYDSSELQRLFLQLA
ncbi:MAG: metal-sensitive transcriptional regulator [Acidimicrobiales bacterium]|nr:metal-sensitive transcriptional regulator [Acidimicrobiales bacterium]